MSVDRDGWGRWAHLHIQFGGKQILCLRFEEDRVDRFLLTLLLGTLALDFVSGEKQTI